MTLKKWGTSFMLRPALCTFSSHQWIQNGVTVWKLPIWAKLGDLEIWRMSLKTKGHLVYFTSSFVHHVVAISELKLEVQSGNPQLGSNATISVPCDVEIWQMTLKNNRAPLLCHMKLCASFHHHVWIQTGVTVRKPLNLSLDTSNKNIFPAIK